MAETPLAQKIINLIEKAEGLALAIRDLKDQAVQIKDSLEKKPDEQEPKSSP